MSAKLRHLCLVLVAICTKHATLSQVIKDFECTIAFPVCKTPGVARENGDIVKFSITLDTQVNNLDLVNWKFLTVMSSEGDIKDNYRRGKLAAMMHLTECSTSDFPVVRYRVPYKRCRRDRNLLYVEVATLASTKYNRSSVIGVWFNQFFTFRKSASIMYPMVILKEVEILKVNEKVMPGTNLYIRPGYFNHLSYCLIMMHPGIIGVYFTVGHVTTSTMQSGRSDWCLGYPLYSTRSDLYKVVTTRWVEFEGPCRMECNSSGLILDEAELRSRSKANGLRKQLLDIVLIFITLPRATL